MNSFRWPFFDIDGVEHCDTNRCLAIMLNSEVLFANSRRYLHEKSYKDETPQPETIVLFVICNDVFYWACADAECLTLDEVGPLYKAWHADRKWGVIKWVCAKRNLQPQVPIVRDMKAAGAWTDELEALPKPEPS